MHDTVDEHQNRLAKSVINYIIAGMFVSFGLFIATNLKWKITLILIGIIVACLNRLGDKHLKKKYR